MGWALFSGKQQKDLLEKAKRKHLEQLLSQHLDKLCSQYDISQISSPDYLKLSRCNDSEYGISVIAAKPLDTGHLFGPYKVS